MKTKKVRLFHWKHNTFSSYYMLCLQSATTAYFSRVSRRRTWLFSFPMFRTSVRKTFNCNLFGLAPLGYWRSSYIKYMKQICGSPSKNYCLSTKESINKYTNKKILDANNMFKLILFFCGWKKHDYGDLRCYKLNWWSHTYSFM